MFVYGWSVLGLRFWLLSLLLGPKVPSRGFGSVHIFVFCVTFNTQDFSASVLRDELNVKKSKIADALQFIVAGAALNS